MAETASHLIDNVLPSAPYRQFVISLPHALRYWAGLNTKLAHKVHKIIKSVIMDQYKKVYGNRQGIHAGGITFEQRFGSGLQFNFHYHILMLDGVFVRNAHGDTIFQNVKLTTKDVEQVTANIARRVIKLLRRRDYIKKDGTLTENPLLDPELKDNPEIAKITAASAQGKILFGKDAGKFVKKIGRGLGFEEELPLTTGEMLATQNGFNIHARTHVNALSRDRLYKLVEYISRPPISDKRLLVSDSGQIRVELKSPYKDGTTHLEMSPFDFLARLQAIIPPPRAHRIKYFGIFAPAHKWRSKIVPNPKEKKGFAPRVLDDEDVDEKIKPKKLARDSRWAQLLKRTFKIDVSSCNKCGAELRIVAAIMKAEEIKRYLDHTDKWQKAPPEKSHGPPLLGPENITYEPIE